jgi:RNA polymerase sigma-70 factor (ECF subfamily)
MLAFVRTNIDMLPRGYRMVLILRDIEALTVPEIAHVLSIAPAEVTHRLHRARQALTTLLHTGRPVSTA